ncbi:MAG: hypothetical protein UW23_C0019G0017 [Candidatus Collierbacteria bacterium GW2011_GWA1_44_12]|uniref:Uncharacterized protein n=1 Tax=Candidatus Collierbacteria bacterium GW2011_GWA1_44_12 TaxID=1618376 RepID=A0A0G1GLN9_9BACT|nr:MAG: hypothetical protein UW23_C0019G0017 [Candidatus Collierbacteria bacterium GW2011_GWA1_44_12]
MVGRRPLEANILGSSPSPATKPSRAGLEPCPRSPGEKSLDDEPPVRI